MKRSKPIRRSKALTARANLARKSRIKRSKSLAKINRKRKAKRYEAEFGTDYADVIRGLPCDTCGAPPPSDPSHARSRGAGGRKEHLYPQCRPCHRAFEDGHGLTKVQARERAEFYWRTYGDG